MRLATIAAGLLFFLAALMTAAPQQAVPDDEIYDQVRLKLAGDRDVRGTTIEVTVKEGIVTLRGRIDKEKNRKKAEKLARNVKGVREVVNELTVAPI